jgi:hypothetical protein
MVVFSGTCTWKKAASAEKKRGFYHGVFYREDGSSVNKKLVNRPHPCRLLITFMDLIKNQTFKFWS